MGLKHLPSLVIYGPNRPFPSPLNTNPPPVATSDVVPVRRMYFQTISNCPRGTIQRGDERSSIQLPWASLAPRSSLNGGEARGFPPVILR